MSTVKQSTEVPCGYCTHCGYGGNRGVGSAYCLHKVPTEITCRSCGHAPVIQDNKPTDWLCDVCAGLTGLTRKGRS